MDTNPLLGYFFWGIILAPAAGYFGYWLHQRDNKWLSTSLVVFAALPLGFFLWGIRKLIDLSFESVAWLTIAIGLLGYVSIYFFFWFDLPSKYNLSFMAYMQAMANAKKTIKSYDGPEDHLKEFFEDNFLKGTFKAPEGQDGAFETWFALGWNGFIFVLITFGMMMLNNLTDLF